MGQIIQCMDREQKIEQLLMMFVQQIKEIPSSIENCYLSVMGNGINRIGRQSLYGEMPRFGPI